MEYELVDNLDLDALIKQGNGYRRRARILNWLTWAVLFVLLGILLAFRADIRSLGGLYHLENGKWQTVPFPFDAVPYHLEISNQGTVWATSTVYAGLYRYQNGQWTKFNSEIREISDAPVQTFVLDGEEVWAVAGEIVLHWDGQKWFSFSGPAALSRASAITVGRLGVFVIDSSGNILRYQEGRWSRSTAASVLPDFIGQFKGDPQLVTAPSGDVFLSYFGVWRFDGTQWNSVKTFAPIRTGQYNLIGTNETTLWVHDSYTLRGLDIFTGTVKFASTNAEIGISANANIESATSHAGKTYLVTSEGLRVFDGASWQTLQPVPPEVHRSVNTIAFDPSGNLWAALSTPQILDSGFMDGIYFRDRWINTFSPFAFFIIMLLVWAVPRIRVGNARLRSGFPILREVMPTLQIYQPGAKKKSQSTIPRWKVYYVMALVFGFLVLVWAGSLTLGLILFYCLLLAMRLVPILRQILDPQTEAATREALRRSLPVEMALYTYLLVLIGVIYLGLWSALSGLGWEFFTTQLVTLSSAYFFGLFLFYLTLLVPVYAIYLGPLARCDYETALRWTENWERLTPGYRSWVSIRATILQFMTDDQELEAQWLKLLTENQRRSVGWQAVGLINVGAAYLRQGRKTDALRLFSGAARILPEYNGVYRTLTFFYAYQGNERALAMSEAMLHFARKPRLHFPLAHYNWSLVLAARALALAQAGSHTDAQTLMERAMRETDQYFKPGLAQLEVNAGLIAVARQDTEAARQHFNKGIAIDPNSDASRDAQRALEKLDTQPA